MQHPFSRRGLLRAGLALGSGLALPSARACEYFTTHLRIHHPWTRVSQHGAADAIVSMRFDEVQQADRLVKAWSPVARGAELGGVNAGPVLALDIPEGSETLLSEDGTYLRLVGLNHPLEAGRSYPLGLAFASGQTARVQLSIDYPALRFS